MFYKIMKEVEKEYNNLSELQKQEAKVYKKFVEHLESARQMKNLTYKEISEGAGREDRQYSYNILKYHKRTGLDNLKKIKECIKNS